MNCPKCGRPLSQFQCSKCKFDIRKTPFFLVGDSADKEIPLYQQYIREEEARQRTPIADDSPAAKPDPPPWTTYIPITSPTPTDNTVSDEKAAAPKKLKNPFSWEVSTIPVGIEGTYMGDAKGGKRHGLGITYDNSGKGTIEAWREGKIDQRLTQFRNSMQEKSYIVFDKGFWDTFGLSNLSLDEKNALERQLNANYNNYIRAELGTDSITEIDPESASAVTKKYVDELLRDWILGAGRFLPRESEIRAGKFKPTPDPKEKSKFSPALILFFVAILVAVFVFVKLQDERGAGEPDTPQLPPAADGNAVSEEYQYYADCLSELNTGLSTGAYKQVLFAKKCVYCLNSDGTITILGNQYSEDAALKADYSSWSDVEHIEVLGDGWLVGLKTDGRILMDEGALNGKADVSDWEDIVSIDVSSGCVLFGLKADGTVLFTPGQRSYDDSDGLDDLDRFVMRVEQQNGCVQIASTLGKDVHPVGLDANGSFIALYDAFYERDGVPSLSQWSGLTSISTCTYPGATDLFGLTGDGKAVYIGALTSYSMFDGSYGEGKPSTMDNILAADEELATWTNISAIDAGGWHFVALKDNGTVLAIGSNAYGQCDVGKWKDIVRVEAYYDSTVGYTSDGAIKMTGYNCLEAKLSDLQ